MSWPKWSNFKRNGSLWCILWSVVLSNLEEEREMSVHVTFRIPNQKLWDQNTTFKIHLELGLEPLGPGINQCSHSGGAQIQTRKVPIKTNLSCWQVNWRDARYDQRHWCSVCHRLGSCTWRCNSLFHWPSFNLHMTLWSYPGTYSPQWSVAQSHGCTQ